MILGAAAVLVLALILQIRSCSDIVLQTSEHLRSTGDQAVWKGLGPQATAELLTDERLSDIKINGDSVSGRVRVDHFLNYQDHCIYLEIRMDEGKAEVYRVYDSAGPL